MEAAIGRTTGCLFHPGETCVCTRRGADCLIVGLLCQPWCHGRANLAHVPACNHIGYPVVMVETFNYIDAHRPLGGICEEVGGFNDLIPTRLMKVEGVKAGTRTYLDLFRQRLAQRGYFTAVLWLHNSDWFNSPKSRRHILISQHQPL